MARRIEGADAAIDWHGMIGAVKTSSTMTPTEKSAIAEIRAALGVKRLDPRRLFLVDDGAYSWIGNRADLTAADAAALRAIHRVGTRPDLATKDERAIADAADYDAICNRATGLAGTDGVCGGVNWEDLPESWRDGSALGPIAPL